MAENEPAFPLKTKRNNSTDPLATPREVEFLGLTMRDWFAGQALQGSIANSKLFNAMVTAAEDRGDRKVAAKGLAVMAYRHADAMMEARK